MTRLLLLVVGATVPAVVVLLSFQDDLRGQREGVARNSALHQAELINLAVGSIVDGASQVMTAMGEVEPIRALSPDCGASLNGLRSHLHSYVFLTVANADGSIACPSSGVPTQPGFAELVGAALSRRGVAVGRYSPAMPGLPEPFICLAQASPTVPGQPALVMIAGLSLEWLGAHLTEIRRVAGASIAVSDSEGTLLAIVSAAPGRPGAKLQPDLLSLVSVSKSGSTVQPSPGGQSRVIGYVPATQSPRGLFVAASFDEDDLIGQQRKGSPQRGYLLIGLGGAVSLVAGVARRSPSRSGTDPDPARSGPAVG